MVVVTESNTQDLLSLVLLDDESIQVSLNVLWAMLKLKLLLAFLLLLHRLIWIASRRLVACRIPHIRHMLLHQIRKLTLEILWLHDQKKST